MRKLDFGRANRLGGTARLSLQRCYNFGASSECESSTFRVLATVGEWLSLVEHLVRDQGVGGSNPLSPTIEFHENFTRLESL
jgi:hypothetical protein